ncbi:hypothetical protein SAMN04487905_10866 [Actinopolyspora xinjiangensis]|uniref:Uncharacterized protein n=1 Tax=Actinopolyspora xinjiangensis TaxID=405564 RepID=A0A1H0V7R4_9ACTN|nr:hypothetical protein SAMN04487905_10866 [Actinopolyspora xinjiangensis]
MALRQDRELGVQGPEKSCGGPHMLPEAASERATATMPDPRTTEPRHRTAE